MAENRVKFIIDFPADQAIQGVTEVITALDSLEERGKRAGETTAASMAAAAQSTAQFASAGQAAANTVDAAWQRLGLRSGQDIRADIAKTIAAYRQIQASGVASAADVESAYKAMQGKVAALRAELNRVDPGRSFRSGIQDVQRFSSGLSELSAALNVLRSAASALGLAVSFREAVQAIKSALAVIDDYKRATIGIAATLTDTAKASGNELMLIYKDNLSYAQETYARVELAAAKFFASGKEMTEAWQILTNKGLRLTSDDDINNLGIIVDKIKLVTQGQSSSLQIAQELRAALSGQARAGDQLAMLLEDRLGPKWKEILNDHLKSGDALQFMASQIKGVGVATEDIQNTISSQLSTQETIINQIIRSGFKEMYQDVLGILQSINGLLTKQKNLISSNLGGAYEYLKTMAKIALAFGMNGVGGAAAAAYNEFASPKKAAADSSFIRQQVRHVTLGASLSYSDVQDAVKNALERENSFLKTPLADQSQEIVNRYAKAYTAMRKAVDSGKLDQSGLASTGSLWVETLKSEGVEIDAVNKKLDNQNKKGQRAAIAADRYEASSQAYYDQTVASLTQMQDSLTGGAEKNLNRVDKWFDQQISSIRRKVIGAKGDVSAYAAAWTKLEEAQPGLRLLARAKDTVEQLKKQAALLQDIASATGSPSMAAQASDLTAKAWYGDKKTLIDTTYTDEAQKTAMLTALQDAYNAKLRSGRAAAYESAKAVSEAYWTAERARITANLETVKKEATDETAYRIYAAEQWDGYYKKLLENQAAYTGTFGATLAAKWDLAFGSYKSSATKARDYWSHTADAVVTLTDGMVSSVGGSVKDFLTKVRQGTATAGDLWDAMCDRMFDAFASCVEDIINTQLKQLLSYINLSGLGSLFGPGSSSIASMTASDTAVGSLMDGQLSTVAGTFANGGAFAGAPGLASYVNSVVDRPTYFSLAGATGLHAFANGVGLMGEAGKEAILPITERSGRLGVDATGVGGYTVVNIHNYSGHEATTQRSTNNNGTETIDIVIGDMVAKQISTHGSSVNQSLAKTFGASTAVIGR